MTVQDCIDRVRDLLYDNPDIVEERRWEDAELIRFCADGLLFIWSVRTDSRLSSTGTLTTLVEPTAVADTLVIDNKWRPALVDYIAFRAFQMPSGERENRTRASEHMASFEKHMSLL